MNTRKLISIALFLAPLAVAGQELLLGIPKGHTGEVTSATYSPDGKYIITSSEDKMVKVWEASTAKVIFTLPLPERASHSAFHPDGKKFLVTSGDSVMLFSNLDGSRLFSIQAGWHAAFTADGAGIIASDPLAIYDLAGRKLREIRRGYTSGFSQSRDGKFLAVATEDSVFVFNGSGTKSLYAIPIAVKDGSWYDEDHCRSILFSPDNASLLLVGEDSTALVLAPASGKPQAEYKAKEEIETASFHPSGRFIALATNEDDVKIIDSHSGQVIRRFPAKGYGFADAARFSTDGKYLLITSADSTRMWDLNSSMHIYSYKNSNYDIFSGDSKWILSHDSDNPWITLRRAENGSIFGHLYDRAGSVAFIRDASQPYPLISSVKNNVLRIWDPMSGRLVNVLEGHKDYVADYVISPDGKLILTVPPGHSEKDRCARIWNASSSDLLYALYDDENEDDQPKLYWQYEFSPDSRLLFVSTSRHLNDEKDGLDVFEARSGRLLYHISLPGNISHEFAISQDGEKLVMNAADSVILFRTADGKQFNAMKGFGGSWLAYAGFHANDSIIIVQDTLIHALNAITGARMYAAPSGASLEKHSFSHDGQHIAVTSDREIRIVEIRTGRTVLKIKARDPDFLDSKWSNTGSYLASLTDQDEIEIRDARSGNLVRRYTRDVSIGQVNFSPNDEYVIFNDNNAEVVNIRENKTVATLYGVEEEYIIHLSSGYYQCSPGASRHLYYVQGNTTIGFEQLDIKYNRPDIVLKEMARITGASATMLESVYHKAYLKRLSKLNIDVASLGRAYSLPVADLVNRDDVPVITRETVLRLHIRARDTASVLQRLNVWINEVPLFGVSGLDLRGKNTRALDTLITVGLSLGENHIEMSVVNALGLESYRKPLLVSCWPEVPERTRIHFVGIGVDEYRDERYNLRLAGKDIRDLAALFRQRFPDCRIDTFINEAATAANIVSIKEKLRSATTEDIVIVSFSGHGVLDQNLDFYCAMYDMDFNNPRAKGLSYEAIERLLEDIPARKKLLLIDACNSGEADKEEIMASARALSPGQAPAGSKGATVIRTRNAANSYEVMRQMFANIGERNGLVVISAAGAKEYAFELRQLENGVFTYCLKKGLFEGHADTDDDNAVSVNELKSYVSRNVEMLTGGNQRPTTRRENVVHDWMVSPVAEGLSVSPRANALADSALSLSRAGRNEQALSLYAGALDALEADSNYVNHDFIRLLREKAGLEAQLRDTIAALESLFRARQVLTKFDLYSSAYDDVLYTIGALYQGQALWHDAVSYHGQRLPVLEEMHGRKSRNYAYALNEIGNIYYASSAPDTAAIFYEEAVDILVMLGKFDIRDLKSSDKDGYVTVVSNLAGTYQELKEYEKEAPLRRELAYYKPSIHSMGKDAKLINDWAIACDRAGQIDRADSLYQEALELLEEMPDPEDYLGIMAGRAALNKRARRYPQALALYQEIVEIHERARGSGSADLAFYLNEVAIINESLGDYGASEKGYRRSAEMYRSLFGTSDRSYLVVSGNLANLKSRKKKKKDR